MAVTYVDSMPEYNGISLVKEPTEIEKKFMAKQDLSKETEEKNNAKTLSAMSRKTVQMIANPSVKPEETPLDEIESANKRTQQIIDDNQKRFNDYYMRLNGRITRDDAGSILGGFVSKADYQNYMDAAKQYAATQQKPNLSDLASFQQAMYDRQEARNELDKLNEQRRVDRERLGQGIGEFSAMLGDIAKASGGALVTPRTIDDKLAALNERERNAYKLYTANQMRIEGDRLKAMQDEEAKKLAAKIKADDRKFELQKLNIEEAGKDARAEGANAAKLKAAYMRMGYTAEQAEAKAKAQMKYEGNLFFPSFIISYEKNGKINKESTNKAIYQLIENYVNKSASTKLMKAWKDSKDLGNKSTNLFGTGTKDYEAIINTFIQHNDYDTDIDAVISDWAEKNGITIEKINNKPTVIL